MESSHWTLREQLILSSAVQKSGDQNWVSVTRAIKPLMEAKRPPEFFSQKNCAMQYAKMLDRASAPKRLKKRSTSRADSRDSEGGGETAQDVIVRQLTEKRIAELDVLLGRIKEEYLHLKVRAEQLQKGELSEKEMQQLLEELTSPHSQSGEAIGSAVHSPLGVAPDEPAVEGMDTAEQLSQSASSTATAGSVQEPMESGPSDPVHQHTLPHQHTPTPITATPAPDVTASTGSETDQAPPSQPGEAPCTTPLPQVNPQLPVDTPAPSGIPQAETSESCGEDVQHMESEEAMARHIAPGFLANIGWYKVEHAYASKPPSPSTCRAEPAASDGNQVSTHPVSGAETGGKMVELDATQVSTVKSMVVAMGSLDVVVSEEKSTRGQLGETPGSAREGVKGPQVDEAKDSETSLNDDKMEAPPEKTPEKAEESAIKELEGTLPAAQDSDSKECAEEKEAGVGIKEEKEEGPVQDKESADSPKPDNVKGRSQTPEIDVESLASSPPAQDDEGEGPCEGMSTSSRHKNKPKPSRSRQRRDRERARQKTPKAEPEEVGTDTPVKEEEHMPSKDGEEEGRGGEGNDKDTPTRQEKQLSRDRSKSSNKKTRSSARGVSKKESEVEEEEAPVITTLRRSARGRDKREERTEATQDSEVDETASNSTMTSAVNSPAPSHGEMGPDQLQSYKAWKRAIMLVWRQIAQHKYANLFLQPVKDEEATGYSEVVHRPMDLTSIKKNVEGGVIRTDIEFQRDILLMFQNALMYNSSDHDVYKMAEEMRADAMEHIHDYLATQLMMQSSSSKPTLRTRRGEGQDKGEEEGSSSRKPSRRPSLEDTPAQKRKK